MKTNINKRFLKYAIAGAVAFTALVLAFIFGGNKPSPDVPKTLETPTIAATEEPDTEPDAEAAEEPVEVDNALTESVIQPARTTEKPSAEPEPTTSPEWEPEPETAPEEPSNAEPYIIGAEKSHVCTVSVRCDTILGNMAYLDPDKAELIPGNGVILAPQTVSYTEGESAFDVTLRVMQKNKIHFEFSKTPAYNSAYIEGINNLYEFDCGELSGWMYRVNGEFYNFGCSQYTVHDGDRIEWLYTCDMGADLGRTY